MVVYFFFDKLLFCLNILSYFGLAKGNSFHIHKTMSANNIQNDLTGV